MTQSATTSRLALLLGLVLGSGFGTAAAQPGAAGETGVQTLRNARDALIDAADFAGALGPAQQIVEAAADSSDPLLGRDLLSLARIQAGIGERDDAEESYLQGIEALIDNEGATSISLVAAYQGLGRNYLNDRRFEEALVAFEDARDISRRNEGLFNVDQASILDDMTLAHLGSGNTFEAYGLQLERLETAVRRFGEDDPELIPFYVHLGDYLDNSRLRIGARTQYERAIELSEASFGPASAETISLLSRVAEIDLVLDQDNGVPAQLEAALAEAAPGIGPIEHTRALIAIADHALVYQGLDAAAPRYREAYELLAAAGTVDPADVFGGPQPLNFVPPLSRVDRNTRRDLWTWGSLTLRFDVAADGRASNVTVAEMSPEIEEIANDYVRRVREAHFRPRLVGGQPVGTADVTYTQNFRFYVEDD